jgi:hypothetical protein
MKISGPLACYSLRLGPAPPPSVLAPHLSPLAAHVGPTSLRPWASQSCLSVLPVQYSHPVVQYSLVNSELSLFFDPRKILTPLEGGGDRALNLEHLFLESSKLMLTVEQLIFFSYGVP